MAKRAKSKGRRGNHAVPVNRYEDEQLWLELAVYLQPTIFAAGTDWTEQDIDKLHRVVLDESLHSLGDNRCGKEEIQDVLEWMNRPLVDRPLPFSFQECCERLGMDVEEMRERALEIHDQRRRPRRQPSKVA